MRTLTILAFVDLHNSKAKIRELHGKAKRADIVICAGDISNFSTDLKGALVAVTKAIGQKPLLIIPGNHEDEDALEHLAGRMPNVLAIQGKVAVIAGIMFFGFGGGGFSMVEPALERAGKKFLAYKQKHNMLHSVFVTHAPPFNTAVDLLPGSGHRGCVSSRVLIARMQPMLALCGHFHETSGKHDKIGKTLVVNPGPGGKLIRLSLPGGART